MPDMLQAAVRNNVAWCDAVCRTHGIVGRLHADRWTAAQRTPARYPDAITLTPTAAPDALLREIDVASPGCSVKDSYAMLDLTPSGFRVLFDATWIRHAPPDPSPDAPETTLTVIDTPEGLAAWEQAWNTGDTGVPTFRPALLEHASIVVLGLIEHRRITAGVIANLSHGCVGISNVFALGTSDDMWRATLAAVARAFPGRPIVGYESGTALEAARRHGFVTLGELRVWLAP